MTSEFDWHYDSYSYLESLEFRQYTDNVRRVIHQSECPISIRTIHLLLGEAAKPSWTADALEAVRDIESVGILPTRYRPAVRRQLPAVPPFNRNLPQLTEAS